MKHVFLTGEIQVGKSTIINKICSNFGSAVQGFHTIATKIDESDEDYLFILPFERKAPILEDKPFAIRNRKKQKKIGFPDVFDEFGTSIIRASMGKDDTSLIIMDELGFFENEAYEFQNEVVICLSGDIPVLGVIKPQSTDFLDRVRSLPDITIIEVTKENRDEIFLNLKNHFK